MPEFQYQGVDREGKKVTGKVEAAAEGEVRMILRGQGVRPVRIGKVSALNTDLGALFRGGNLGKIPIDALAIFTRQLHVLIASGIPLVQSLDVLMEQVVDPTLKKILPVMKEKVSGGSFLWESMTAYSSSFPRIYVALIRAGEASGAMETVLDRLAVYLETSDKLRKTVKSAMMYPAMVISVGVIVVAAMLVFVIPKFEGMLKQAGAELPGPTQFVVNISHFLQENFMQLLGGIGIFVFILVRYVRSDEGRGVADRVMFKMPLLGTILQRSGVARFSRTLGTLLSSGVNLIDAIDISKTTVDNVVIEDAISTIRKEIEAGKTLGTILKKLPVFPKMAVQMVAVGESTGNLEHMLDRVATIYESEVETLVEGMSKLVEPALLVVLGGIIGAIMLAMYLPIFKLAGSVG